MTLTPKRRLIAGFALIVILGAVLVWKHAHDKPIGNRGTGVSSVVPPVPPAASPIPEPIATPSPSQVTGHKNQPHKKARDSEFVNGSLRTPTKIPSQPRVPQHQDEPKFLSQPEPQVATSQPSPTPPDATAASASASSGQHESGLVSAGTELTIRINDELNSEKAQIGDVFHGSISSPIMIDGQIVVPTTADVEGRVVEVKSAEKFAGQSVLSLELTKLKLNGRTYNLETSQWTKSGSGRGKSTAAKVGGGAAVGAVLGGIFGGSKGAAVGSAAGAGAGTGSLETTKGHQIILRPEAVLAFQLQSPLQLNSAGSDSATPANPAKPPDPK
jgi:hypothetical protein